MKAPFLACLFVVGLANGVAAQTNDAAPFGAPVMDDHVFYHLMLNQLEGRFGDTSSFRWSGEAWLGTDDHRLWLRSEGRLADGRVDDGQHELLYARPISTWFNAMVGGRYEAGRIARERAAWRLTASPEGGMA